MFLDGFILATLLCQLIFYVSSCGDSYPDESAGGPPVSDPAYAAVAPIVNKNCGTCHNGSTHPLKLDSGAKLKAAAGRIRNGSMPPAPRKLTPDDKTKLLEYVEG